MHIENTGLVKELVNIEQNQMTVLVCMADSFYRLGLVGVLTSLGFEIELVEKADDIDTEVNRQIGYLIIGEVPYATISEVVSDCLQHITPTSKIVLADRLKLSEIDKLRSLGVNAVLETNIDSEELYHVMSLLPQHFVINMDVVTLDNPIFLGLTPREGQIISLLAKIISVKEIAKTLKIAEKTVESHKYTLMKKLEVHSGLELSIWYMKNK